MKSAGAVVQEFKEEFAEAVVKNLGKKPNKLLSPVYKGSKKIVPVLSSHATKTDRKLVGVDLFVYAKESAATFQKKITALQPTSFKLQMIGNRGARIWPNGHPETFCIEQWRCRFVGDNIQLHQISGLLDQVVKAGFEVVKTENLYTFDGKAGYSSAEG